VKYRVSFTASAEREFDKLDFSIKARIARALDRLAVDPRAAGNVKALVGGNYRLRVGDWRVLYSVQDHVLVVLVLRIGHRREVYR
jgi:mRNA interferase RelE/StbE